MPEAAPHGFRHAARHTLFGALGVAVITFTAVHFHLQRFPPPTGVGPGTISLLYLIFVVFVSLRAGFASAAAVSLISAFCLNYFFLPLFPALEAKNPLGIVATIAFLITAWVITGMVARLRLRHALLDGLFEHGPLATVLIDANAKVVCVNREFTRLFGYSSQEALGRRLNELIVPADSQGEFHRQAEKVARRQRLETEVVSQRKDGSRFHVQVVAVPISMPDGRLAIYAMYRDITERKEAEAALRTLSGRLLKLEDEWRRRLARELHDTTAQLLAALSMNLAVVNESAALLNPRTRAAMAEAVALADQCLREVRTVSYLLYPRELDDLGLEPALAGYIDGFIQRSGIRVEAEISPDVGRLPQDVETAVFRVVQECLANIYRHSGSSTARLRLARGPSSLVLEVEDAGRGIRDDAPSGVGIASMRERVQQLGGSLEIASHPGGTIVRATIPLSTPSA
jgi:PAS domain S-box-containing protein